MNRWALLMACLLAGAGGMYAGLNWDELTRSARPKSTGTHPGPISGRAAANGSSDDAPRGRVVGLGRLQPERGILEVGLIVGERVQEVLPHEGDTVEADAVLARFASRELRRIELETAQSQLEMAKSRHANERLVAEARTRLARLNFEQLEQPSSEIEAQDKEIAALREAAELTHKDLERIQGLSERLVSAQERGRQEVAVRKADAEVRAAEARLEATKQTRELNRQTARAELGIAEANEKLIRESKVVEVSEGNLGLARRHYEQTELLAPTKGTVLRVLTQPGEVIVRRPVLQMADLNTMICVAEVFETEKKLVEVGQTVRIESGAFHAPYDEKGLRGTVERVGETIASPHLTSIDPSAPADRRVFDVFIRLEGDDLKEAAKFVNLQVSVVFLDGKSE